MTLLEAVKQKCWECHKQLNWNGYAGYEHTASCCQYIYTLKPRVEEYDFEVSKAKIMCYQCGQPTTSEVHKARRCEEKMPKREYTPEELKRFKESGVIPGKDGGLFHHPV